MNSRLLKAVEVAHYIGTSVGQIYQMVSRRQIPFVKIGRSTRFDRVAIDEWIGKLSVPSCVRRSGRTIRSTEGRSYTTEN